MPGKLHKFLALPVDDKLKLFLAALWLPLTHMRLRCFGLQSCLRKLAVANTGTARQETLDDGQFEQALACERSVALASRHGLVAGTCLSRSLTMIRLLARHKLNGQLRIGVNLDSGMLEAHAWVEVAGISLEQRGRGFEPFPPLNN
jgi:hypothetical protein